MSEQARREIEDLWWLLHSLEALIEGRENGEQIRIGLLRSVVSTTRPETSTTDPRANNHRDDEGRSGARDGSGS